MTGKDDDSQCMIQDTRCNGGEDAKKNMLAIESNLRVMFKMLQDEDNKKQGKQIEHKRSRNGNHICLLCKKVATATGHTRAPKQQELKVLPGEV